MRVLAVTHGPTVQPELFGDLIVQAGHSLDEWKIGEAPRPAARFDAALVLGGAQNVGEEDRFPWLEEEYELLRELVAERTPVLAICLGAQALAHAFGAHVPKLPRQQAGFSEVWLTAEGRGDPVLGVLPGRFEALLGNAYGFEVPERGVLLADSEASPQAFRLGDRAWAVQFHPEARRDQALGWFAENDGDSLPRPLPELEQELDEKIEGWHALGRALCLSFLEAALPAAVTG